ncbi:MAG: class I SAM-dependent methyltransferase [Rhodospirillaceae bacterium]|nr:class I SAM-dependent methyltransferase [Rhodospirillales bacterium]
MMSLDDLHDLARQGRFDALLRTAIRVQTDDPVRQRFQQGAAALKRNDAFAAVAAFEDVATLDPAFPALWDALASAYRRDARYEDCVAVANRVAPTRQLRYETAMSLLAQGDAAEALAVLEANLAEDPDHAASWFTSHAPVLELHGVDAARERLDRATACAGANGKYEGFRAAYALLAGESGAHELVRTHVAAHPARRALVDGVSALLPHCPQPPRLFGLSASLLRYALAQAEQPGLVLEFGVRRGTSITVIGHAAGQPVHGFDSFEGLPVSWGSAPAGVLTTGLNLPPVPANVTLHAGWFDDTLPPFLTAHPGPVRLVNVDSDIYSSARTVLTALIPRIQPGTVLVFDEFIGNRSWAEDEYKAFAEYVASTGVRWRVLALAPFTKQVAVVIEG